MIGGYAQLAYSFNYYGTVALTAMNLLWYVKMKQIDWLDGEGDAYQQTLNGQEGIMKIRSQVGMVLNLDKCIGCHTCSVTCKMFGPVIEGVGIRLV